MISLARGARLLQATIFACKRRISSSVSRPTAELCRVEFKPNYCQKTFTDRAHEIDANGFRVSKIPRHLKRRRILGMDRGCHIPHFYWPRGAKVGMMTKKKLGFVCVMLIDQPQPLDQRLIDGQCCLKTSVGSTCHKSSIRVNGIWENRRCRGCRRSGPASRCLGPLQASALAGNQTQFVSNCSSFSPAPGTRHLSFCCIDAFSPKK